MVRMPMVDNDKDARIVRQSSQDYTYVEDLVRGEEIIKRAGGKPLRDAIRIQQRARNVEDCGSQDPIYTHVLSRLAQAMCDDGMRDRCDRRETQADEDLCASASMRWLSVLWGEHYICGTGAEQDDQGQIKPLKAGLTIEGII